MNASSPSLGLRLTNWALQVASLGLETFTSFGCIVYLLAVRYCLAKPSAQGAQFCLAISGYFIWLSCKNCPFIMISVVAIITILGIISFEGTTIFESITTNIKINGMTGRLPSVCIIFISN